MGKTGIPVRMNTYDEARNIVQEYQETRLYLTSIIQNHIPNAEDVLSCSDLMNLKHYGRVIKGVAERMLKTYIPKDVEKSILENISSLEKIEDSGEKQLLEERISIQLEGCNVPDSHPLAKKYKKVCNN